MKKKMYTLLVLILCVTMVFTSCGTGGTSSNSSDSAGSAYTATTGDDKEVTVDEDDVKLETEIVSGDPSEVGPKSLKETIKDTVKGIFGKDSDETDSSDDAQDIQTGDNTSSVTTVSNDSKNADKTSTVDANSVIGAAIKSKIESEEKQKEIEKASQTNVSSASDTTGYDENGDPEVPYDELNEEAFEDPDVKYADNAILIKFDKTFGGKLTKGLKKAGIGKLEYIFGTSEYSWYTGYILKSANLAETMGNVRDMDNVITAEYNYVSEAAADTSDAVQTVLTNNPRTGEQSVLNSCGIKEAWASLEEKGISAGGSSDVVVAVIDTGVDYTHVDLKANMWKNTGETEGDGVDNDKDGYVDDVYGVDITTGKGSAMDDEGHGTHVAGIIAASNNKEGIVGIAYNTKIMAIKAGDASGYFLENNVAKAIIYAYEHGADVINMSFGSTSSSTAIKDALTVAYSDCVLVASAGNSGKPNEKTDYYDAAPNYPAAYSFVLGVMSVDSSNTESYFTNWDASLYNSVEYEVYAPGEQILSTLPGDRYAKLSGTSMAAPVVAAEAALLRSYYKDTTQYPTKYIYGQIIGGTVENVNCAKPGMHGKHNIPGVVNFDNALNSSPKPDISIIDHALFDTAGFSADTEGITKGCEEINNGDGIIDAGETFALGFTLKNRWGMSENTTVSIDAKSETAEIDNPYVTILNNDIDYGEIGTYSEGDSGKIYTDDNAWTGWENPFYIRVSEDCPNGYSITLNITVTYENALDDSDTTIYTEKDKIVLEVRRGVILPDKIEGDMTLTENNYYIIPRTTTIKEGATVTVEPGTQIQFWCSDSEDVYAETAIAGLIVEGSFVCEGTEEKPITIFPSEWKKDYAVEIYEQNSGYVGLNYAEITNPYLYYNGVSTLVNGITDAENCSFRQNQAGSIHKGVIYTNGTIGSTIVGANVYADNVYNSSFYKVEGTLYGSYKQCSFIDSAINFDKCNQIKNCIFYGNNNYDEGEQGSTSHLNLSNGQDTFTLIDGKCFYEEGKMYLTGEGLTSEIVEQFFDEKGLKYAEINTSDELNSLFTILDTSTHYYIEDVFVGEDGRASYIDGEEISDDIIYEQVTEGKYHAYIYNKKIYLSEFGKKQSGTSYKELYEATIPVYVEDIILDEYLIDLDMEKTYKIYSDVTPANVSSSALLYESEDETVATVSSDGIISPKGIGTTRIKVSSSDGAVYTFMTVNVRSKTISESISFDESVISLQVGKQSLQKAKTTPRHATEKDITYTSSDESIATVQENGLITAIAPGTVKITATGYNDLTAELEVNCYSIPEKISFKNSIYVTSKDKNDGKEFYPEIYPSDASSADVEWEIADTNICNVDASGNLVKNNVGITDVMARIKGTDLSATTKIAVVDGEVSMNIKKIIMSSSYGPYVLKENGEFGRIESGKYSKISFANSESVKDVEVRSVDGTIYYYVLNSDGKLQKYKTGYGFTPDVVLNGISFLSQSSRSAAGYGSMFAVTNDGDVVAWGTNTYGQLGITASSVVSDPTLIEVGTNAKIQKILSFGYKACATLFLDEDGNLYLCGTSANKFSTPQLIKSDVKDIYSEQVNNDRYNNSGSQYAWIVLKNGEQYKITGENGYMEKCEQIHDGEVHNVQHDFYIEDGRVYIKGDNSYGQLGIGKVGGTYSEYIQIPGIDNAVNVFDLGTCLYIQTSDGNLYGIGEGKKLANTEGVDSATPVQSYFGVSGEDKTLALDSCNHDEATGICNTTPDKRIIYDFNWVVSNRIGAATLADSDGTTQIIKVSKDFDKVIIEPKSQLVKGAEYTVSFKNSYGSDLSLDQTFTYDGQPVLTSWNHTEKEVADTAGETADQTETDLDNDENVETQKKTINIVSDEKLTLTYDVKLFKGGAYNAVTLKNSQNVEVSLDKDISDTSFELTPKTPFIIGETYTLTIPEGALISRFEDVSEGTVLTFTYNGSLHKIQDNLTVQDDGSLSLGEETIRLTYNGALAGGTSYENIALTTEKTVPAEETSSGLGNDGTNEVTDEDTDATDESKQSKTTETTETVSCNIATSLDEQSLVISLADGVTWEDGKVYTLTVPAGAVKGTNETTNEESVISFTYKKPATQTESSEAEQTGQKQDTTSDGTTDPTQTAEGSGTGEATGTITPDSNDPEIPDDSAYDVKNEAVKDAAKIAARTYPSIESITADWNQYVEDGLNTLYKGNAILNRLIDDDVTKWLRIKAPTGSSDIKVGLGGNYWGTTSKELINEQIQDSDDGIANLADINEGKYLTEAPSDVWPFVVDAYVMVDGKEVETVGNQEVTFVVEFNRDMDTTIPLSVKFGSSYPYGDYEVSGEYKTARRWEGTMKLNTMIENGYQRFSISNGKAAGTSMKLFNDWGRFQFKINTTEAQALTIQAERTSDGIKLSWEQDDFETLAGFNIYRATEENGLYEKLNKSIISAEESEWLDSTVSPGEVYYYNFTVVESDMTESEPSGTIKVRAFDTLAPGIRHSQVNSAFTGSKLVISANVTDNVGIDTVTLYYRVKSEDGSETENENEWLSVRMTNYNDKYTAAITSNYITTAGLEYYIEAKDNEGNLEYSGSAENPYEVTVKVAVDESSKGDVDGNGVIEVKDAMILLLALNHRMNLTDEQFARADIDGSKTLTEDEALRILKYINGTITSIVA